MPSSAPLKFPAPTVRSGTASLVGLTPESRAALGAEVRTLRRLPYRVGRECRTLLTRVSSALERRLGSAAPLNDLYLQDPAERYVSREHFLIDYGEEGYFLVDRGSDHGTIVAGRSIGGHRRGGYTRLHDQDIIILGSPGSPFVFRFRCD